jgi:hypothetical protein
MTFEELLDQAIAMLQRRGRMTYRTLQRQFALDVAGGRIQWRCLPGLRGSPSRR